MSTVIPKQPIFLVVMTFIALTFMKFRVVSVTLSDIFLIICFGILFLRNGLFKVSLYSYLMSSFVALAICLAILQGGGHSIFSAFKLIVPLFLVMVLGARFERFNALDMLRITKTLLFFGVFSQLFVVLVFYTGLADGMFNIVEPGNINRTISDFKLNTYPIPLVGMYRFCSLFIEPSWFAFFFGFFLILYFYQCRSGHVSISLPQDMAIILAFLFTISFTGFAFLLFAYTYRFFDSRRPIRLIIFVPVMIVLLVWVIMTNDYLAHRIFLISTGKDNSFNARIFESLDKTIFILNYTDWLGAGPSKTLDLINRYFQQNLTIQNAYLEAFAATGFIGGGVFLCVMHYSLFRYRNFYVQLPLVLALCVSSIIFTPIFWLFSFYIIHVSRVCSKDKPTVLN